jgi:hypothetical protein
MRRRQQPLGIEPERIETSVRRAFLAGHRGKPAEHFGLFAHLREQLGFRVSGDVLGNSEDAVRSGRFGVDHALRNAFTVEMGQFVK